MLLSPQFTSPLISCISLHQEDTEDEISVNSNEYTLEETFYTHTPIGVNWEMDSDEPRVQEMKMKPISYAGYKIMFDNLDKTIKLQTKSLHFIHSYAMKDRIDLYKLSDEMPTEVNIWGIIPNEVDYLSLKSDFTKLISSMIVEHNHFLALIYEGLPLQHIPHKFSKEMSNK